jgi:hypothetical protein
MTPNWVHTVGLIPKDAMFQIASTSAENNAAYSALVDFYTALNGDNWVNNDNWLNASISLDEWFGLGANGSSIHTMIFFENGLSGTIPDSITNLTSLR